MKNMQQMMKQVKKMQDEMQKAQEQLKDRVVEGTAGGGAVVVKANGHKQVIDVTINPEVVDPEDVEMLQDLVLAAINDAMKNVDEVVGKEMGRFTGGMNIPGLF
ncbi:YbaB/EbfC family nucleoid-associated protein [Brevibacillus laterosporus]|uniref:Nucleoid-associated protein C4A77_14470 n=1 Tax=Brevibacillus laterosporus TaxID=1465 RepID=A0AAP8QBW6_BRELA|nr:YbaB/EbfC family nucleoid-associated protein [Brevibacillus laterosporus]ATO49444.1 YbaB/EbfC family nucleoid-associated protein [Brevibacillus laterosporus DSM 25]AYB40457.1 YbaB/EbfC family nucleoid-associated protein [Brevibacillus laterosporus]MBG9772294.1 nucleoid-associated protein [Brevibacillus laterosporus]MBG9787344.1 nucleoid-associated protein [Brevibacillus laterosporus]MBG9799069.1 nucleoid-associated protein [Brevibacillus laterosporus]